MRTFSNNDSIYIGREAGKEIHENIRNAKKSVKIVSPYLSPDYVKDLLKLHNKGVKITLITCDKIETNDYSDLSTLDLVKKEKIINEKSTRLKKKIFKLFAWMFVFSILSAIPAFIFPMLFFLSGIFLLASLISLIYSLSISDYSYKYNPLFRIKVFDSHSGKKPYSTELIHSKIFIIDESVCFLGSANLTYSGFKTHYETAIKIQDARAISDISEEVEMLYASKELKAKSVEEWM